MLYLNHKKYHWFAFGPLFRDVHQLFDEQGIAVLEMVDEFAERACGIDGGLWGDFASYSPRAIIKPSAGEIDLYALIVEAIENHDIAIREMHADADAANAAGDSGTADLYTRQVQTHQKQRWFLRQLLRDRDGLLQM